MRLSHFWQLMDGEFTAAYSRTLADRHVLGALGGRTVTAALEAGVPPKHIWLALCEDLDVPPERRLGRDPDGPPA